MKRSAPSVIALMALIALLFSTGGSAARSQSQDEAGAWSVITSPAIGARVEYPAAWMAYTSGVHGTFPQAEQIFLSERPAERALTGDIVLPKTSKYFMINLESTGASLADPAGYIETYLATPLFHPPSETVEFGGRAFLMQRGDLGAIYYFWEGARVYSVLAPLGNTDEAALEHLLSTITITGPVDGLDESKNPDRRGWLYTAYLQPQPQGVTAIPSMKMPWDSGTTTTYNSGPHGAGDTNYSVCNPYSLSILAGLDFGLTSSNEVLATAGGTITYYYEGTNTNGGLGNYVQVDHGGGWITQYWHLSSVSQWVKDHNNQAGAVQQGQVLGRAGSTGGNWGEHLHLQLKNNGSPYGWNGESLDGYMVRSIIDAGDSSRGLNYQGTLTKGSETLSGTYNYPCTGSFTRPGKKYTGSSVTVEAIGGPVYSSNSRKDGGGGGTTCSTPSASSPNNDRINQTSAVTFSWGGDCSQYQVEYWGGPAGTVNSGWVSGSSWTFGTMWGGSYSWHVKGISSSGTETGYSSTLNFTVVPNRPTGLSASAASQSQVNLSWNDPGGEKDGYRVYRSDGSQIGQTSSTSFQATGLSCATGYSFYVKAYKGGLESDASDQASETTNSCSTTCSVPSPNSPINTRIGQTTPVTFSWSGDCSQYQVEYWGGPAGTVNSGWVSGSSWTFGTMWSGSYTWHVRGISSSGVETGYSYTPTFSVVPNTPTGLTATATSCSQVALSWSDPGGEKEGYRVYRADGSLVGQTAETSYTVTGLAESASHSFVVRAYRGSLESDPSQAASANTPTCPVNTPCYSLSTASQPAGAGTVQASPAPTCQNGTKYYENTVVTLTAAPGTGYAFTGWSGGATGATNPLQLTMSADRSVTAQFGQPLQGRVDLQGRGTAPSAAWAGVPLVVTARAGGCSAAGSAYAASTSTNGSFNVSQVFSGVYAITVKNAHTLSVCLSSVSLPAAGPLYIGTLLEGDASGDDCVLGADFSILRTTYARCAGTGGYDGRADFNGDGCVAGADFSLLRTNYNRCGPVVSTAQPQMAGGAPAEQVTLALDGPAGTLRVGQAFELTLAVEAGAQGVDAVDAWIGYDPRVLALVEAPRPAVGPVVLDSQVDAGAGRVAFSAGWLEGEPPNGTVALARLRFRVIAPPGNGPLVWLESGSGAYANGEALPLSLRDAPLVFRPVLFLPGIRQ